MKKAATNTGTGARTKGFGSADYIKIAILGFALSALWSSLHTIIMPLRLMDFVPEALKNTYLGLLTFTGLILAMAVQPVAGAISDRSGFSWGRRRPYILLGTILILLFLPGIGYCGSYTAIFIIYCLLQISSNIAQGSYQGFIPDLVPEKKRGLASGVKSLLEIGGGVALLYPIALFMDRYFAGGGNSWLWLSVGALAVALLGTMLATVLLVKEQPGTGRPQLRLLPTLYRSFKIDVKANRNFIWFLVSRLFVIMAFVTLQTFALYFLKDVIGVADPAAAAARFSIVVAVCMLAVVYPAGHLSDRIGRKPIIGSAGFLSALGVMALFFSSSYGSVIFCGGLIGIAFGAFMSSNWALATDLVTKDDEARFLGLTNLASAGGSALARLNGPMIDFFNHSSPNLGYKAMLLVCFISFVIGSLLLLKIKRRT